MADETKRMNYFDHQFLREDDLNLQQDYHMDRHRRHNRLQHTWGVASGLQVEFLGGASSVSVRTGTAIDGEGREIVLAADVTRELSAIASDQDVYITLSYSEELSDPTTETGAEGNTRWNEIPLIEVSISQPENPELTLVLALVTRTGTTVTAVDNEVRTQAGVVGGDLQVSSLTLTSSSVIPAQWPSMSLGVAQRADVEGSLRITQDLIVEGTITGDIAVSSVETADLVNSAVTNAKLANNSVNAAKIAANAVGSSELATNSVTTSEIAANAVGTSELINNAVNNAKVAAGSINHSRLNLDGGSNPHGTTAADVGALALTGGAVNGNVSVNGQLSSVRTNTGGGLNYALYGSATGNSTGQVRGVNAVVNGTGTGAKYGVLSSTSGTGNKYGGYYTASTASGDNSVTYGLYSNSSSAGNGTTFCLRALASGTGTGAKYGVRSSVSGGGFKYGGNFRADTPSTVTSATYGGFNQGTSAGTGQVFGVRGHAAGTGAGTKYGVYGSTFGAGTRYAGYFSGNVHVTGTLSKTSGTFLIDHPLDPFNKTLRHNFVESPESLCLYRGKVKLGDNGKAKVTMPDYFATLTTEDKATVTLTCIGRNPFLAGYEWNDNYTAFTIYGEAGGEVSYLVLADRDDPAMNLLRRPVEENKGGGNFEQGKLLCPEAYGELPEKGVDPIFEESLSKEELKEFKDEEKALQLEVKAQEKLQIEMEKEEQKKQAMMVKELEKETKEQEKVVFRQGKNNK